MKKKKQGDDLPEFDVYKQSDGALIALDNGEDVDNFDLSEEDAGLVWSGSAVDKRDAIKQARKSDKSLKKAPVADSSYDPDMPDVVRENREAEVNERLGIKSAGKKKSAKKKVAAKKKAVVRKTAKKKAVRRK